MPKVGCVFWGVFPRVIFKLLFLGPEQVSSKTIMASGELKISQLLSCQVTLTEFVNHNTEKCSYDKVYVYKDQ